MELVGIGVDDAVDALVILTATALEVTEFGRNLRHD